jgi:HTH-type transcriptional regulator/antitoxin HipB
MASSTTPKQLGSTLRRYRKKKPLTQAQLSSRIGMRQATISTLESFGTGTLETLFSVLSALDLELVIRPRTKTKTTRIEEIF